MKLTDVAPLEKWIDLEKDIQEMTGLCAAIMDVDGMRINPKGIFVNKLCPAIKKTEKGQTYICSVSHMDIANTAKEKKASVVEECEAGMVKYVVPIFVNNEFLGTAGGCGLLFPEGEVEAFYVNKLTGMETAEIENLAGDIQTVSKETIDKAIDFTKEKVDEIVSGYSSSV